MEQRPKKLLEQVQDVIRLKHYSYQTEKTYIYWIRRYILFHNKRHPKDMGSTEIETFLTHLAVNENVAASTPNQALHPVLRKRSPSDFNLAMSTTGVDAALCQLRKSCLFKDHKILLGMMKGETLS